MKNQLIIIYLNFSQVLRLEKSGEDADTESLFAEVWGRGQPVVVGDVSARLDAELWQPGCFARKEIPIVAESVLEKYKVRLLALLYCKYLWQCL